MGLFEAAGHSPNRTGLATRKVGRNDEILASFAPAVRLFRAVDKAPTQPYLCETGAVAMAPIWPRFSSLIPG
jgi:hypothetical protein